MPQEPSMLEIHGVSGGYGGATVIHDVALAVAAGETVALLGPNGAGKSTLLAALSGTLPTRSGRARFSADGESADLMQTPSHRIVAAGVAQVPEGRRVFAPFSVAENLALGTVRLRRGPAAARYDFVYALFPRLKERHAQLAGTLSGGEQQMLAIGRALMCEPKLLLLDEPFLGLAPRVVEEIQAALARLRTEGLTMLLVEQKLDIALGFASRAYIMIKGRIALTDTTANLAERDDLGQLYFDLAIGAGGVTQ
jgi:branched-chain amino acid transport system ATP-binding protein